MAVTFTFALVANKVVVTEDVDGVVSKRSLRPDYNVLASNKDNTVLITDKANDNGNDDWTVEYRIDRIATNPTPTDVAATVEWLSSNFFKGDSIADLSVDTVNVDIVRSDLETIKNEADDMVKTATYYGGVEAGNPSGNTDNMKTLVYSSAALALTVTKTFTWDATDNFLTETLS